MKSAEHTSSICN